MSLQTWIQRFQQRVLIGEFLRHAADGLALYLFVFGGAVLAVRLGWPSAWPHVMWLLLGSLPVAGFAFWVAKRRLQSPRETVAMLDKSIAAGGLLMTLTERGDAYWSEQLPKNPQVWWNALPRLSPRRFARQISPAILFAVISCFVPLREIRATNITPQAAAQEATQELETLTEQLAEAQVLEKKEQEVLKEEIQKLVEETENTPLTHENWETVEALRERMELHLDKAAASGTKLAEAVNRLAEAAAGEGEPLTPDELQKLEKEVEQGIEELIKKEEAGEQGGASGSGMSGALKEQLQRLTKKGQNGKPREGLPKSPKDREELMKQLAEHLEKESRKLDELKKKCKACKSGNCNKEGECEGNCEKEGECEGGKCKPGSRPGKGGVTRGRADAELTFGDETDEQGAKFKETLLPHGFSEDPTDDVRGVTLTAPTVENTGSVARDTARQQKLGTGSATWEQKLSPRHRSVVRKYFGE